jgi:hypothetical protein
MTVLVLAATSFLSVEAQACAMCQTVIPQANEPIARGMFWSVLLLLTAPFAVSATVGGWIFYQYWRAKRTPANQRSTADLITLRHREHHGKEPA